MPQQFSAPFGDIFRVETPSLDQMNERLYNEELQMKLLRQKQANELDEQITKNVANIRDADVDDFTKAYQDWKFSKQALMKQKKLNPQEYAQQQLVVNRKLADLYKLANASKSEKEREEDLAKRIVMKPDDFNDHASKLMVTARNTPLSKLKTVEAEVDGTVGTLDLTDIENYLYRDKTNWQPILQKAAGTVIPRGTPIEKPSADGLQREVTTYKGGNDPLSYYNSIVGSLAGPRAGESLSKRFTFTPEEAQTITDEFNRLKETPEFKNAYGAIEFPESSNMSSASRTAKLLAMQHAIQNKPSATVSYKPNTDAITNRREDFTREMTEKRHQNSLARLYVYAGIQDRKPEAIGRNIDEMIAQHIQYARDNNGEVVVDNDTWESLTGVPQTKNSVLMVDESGNYQYGKKDPTTGKVEVWKPVPFQLAKTKWTKEYKSGLDAKFNTGTKKPEVKKEKFPLPPGKPRTVKQNGHTYTWDSERGNYF